MYKKSSVKYQYQRPRYPKSITYRVRPLSDCDRVAFMHMRRGLILLSLCLLPVVSEAAETHERIRFQLGEEYDSNVNRAYTDPQKQCSTKEHDCVVEDGLTRLLFQAQVELNAPLQQAYLDYMLGVKIFHHQTSASMLVNWLQLRYQYNFLPFFTGGARLTLQDETLVFHSRDYRLHQAELFERFTPLDWLKIELSEGGRYFLFKPDNETKPDNDTESLYPEKYSYSGPLMTLRFMAGREQGLSGGVTYDVDWRFFQADKLRRDTRQSATAQVRYQLSWFVLRQLIVEGMYMFSWNQSNREGFALQWHRLRLLISVQLPADCTLHVMGTLQFSNYLGGMYHITEPEADENENALVIKFSYQLGKGFSLVLNGGLYRNTLYSGNVNLPSYNREVVMLGLAYDFAQ